MRNALQRLSQCVYLQLIAFYSSFFPFHAKQRINVTISRFKNMIVFSDSLSAIDAIRAHYVQISKIIEFGRKFLDFLASKGTTAVYLLLCKKSRKITSFHYHQLEELLKILWGKIMISNYQWNIIKRIRRIQYVKSRIFLDRLQ